MDTFADPFADLLSQPSVAVQINQSNCAGFSNDWDMLPDDLFFGDIIQVSTNSNSPVTSNDSSPVGMLNDFGFPDTTGYPYVKTNARNCGANDFLKIQLPIEKSVSKPKLIPCKETELQMNSKDYDSHIQNYISEYGPLTVDEADKVKDQRRRIRNRESANNSRKKKKTQQQNIRAENAELKAENKTLKEEIERLKKELDLFKNQFQSHQDKFQYQSQDIRLQKQQLQQQLQQQDVQNSGLQQVQSTIQRIQRNDHPPDYSFQEDQQQSFQQPQLWRINTQPVSLRPVILTSFIILFTFILFIPHLQTTPITSTSSSSLLPNNLTRDDFHMKKVTMNPQSNALELVPTNEAFPSFIASNMIGGGGRTLLMIDDFSTPENSTSVSQSTPNDYYVVESEHHEFDLGDYEDLTYVLLVQSPSVIEQGEEIDSNYIDIIVPSGHENSILHITSKIVDKELIPGSSSYFPTISEAVYSLTQ